MNQDKKFLLRFDTETHKRLSDLAWAERKSMNQWLVDKINESPVAEPKPRPSWVEDPPENVDTSPVEF